ncbi:MAG: cob(I)yrinic acid a,c-diamide adenosyltransferase [Sulfobacillus sp.]
MKIYTRTGDLGQTSLWGRAVGKRVSKDSVRVEAYGSVDEANAVIGLARNYTDKYPQIDQVLEHIQHRLFALGADLYNINPDRENRTNEDDVSYLETVIDQWDQELEPLRHFILPSGSPAVSHLQVARTVVRRAERRVVSLALEDPNLTMHVKYLNRLSDLIFVAARLVNRLDGVGDAEAKF